MIEFNGYLTGTARKHFFKRMDSFTRRFLFLAMLLNSPLILCIASWVQSLSVVLVYISVLFIVPPLVSVLRSKKEKIAITPKRIFVEDEYIICVTDKYVETKAISVVKQVRDFGDFYDLVFPVGNVSDRFVCQKSLLSKGTLEEFEALFKGKIVRKSPE